MFFQLVEAAKPFDAEATLQQLQRVQETPRMIVEVFQQHNSQMQALLSKVYALGKLERYGTSLYHIRSFLQYKCGIDDLNIKPL